MPNSYLPVPDGYILWRDNEGRYHVSWYVPGDEMRGNFRSRSKALYWLYTLIGKQAGGNTNAARFVKAQQEVTAE